MKKTVMIVATGLFLTGLKAQNIQEGVNHLYADRFQHAVKVFEGLLAANPNNTDAAYWLGQTYLDMDVNAKARDLYDKTLTSSNNAPLILVGRAHVDLLDKKLPDARQKFETAITMTRGKKGDDPVILNAVGRAIVDAIKDTSMLSYAVEKLKTAAERDDKNPDIFINLGNAIRKARPGEGGGEAYTNYQKAIALNPNFPIAYFRLAKLFEGQKNWDLVTENLNKATSIDPKFAAAYYELFFYYLQTGKNDQAETALQKMIDSKTPYSDPADQYLYGQLCWVKKDFKCAIQKGESVVSVMGAATKPKVYLLLADAYYMDGDSMNAKKYIDQFFTREKPEDLVQAYPYALRARIYLKFPGQEQIAYDNVLQGVKMDTVIENKLKTVRDAALDFRKVGRRDLEGNLFSMAIEMSPKPVIQDYDGGIRAYYYNKPAFNTKSRDIAIKLQTNWPAEVYGYDWAFNNSRLLDTVKRDSIAVPDAVKLFDYVQKDTVKFKSQLIRAASYLAEFYANYATPRDKDKAITYLERWMWNDPANAENIANNIKVLRTAPAGGGAAPRGNATPTKQPAGTKPSPAVKPKTTTAAKTGAVKK
jgi:tetratricopeptide (TPR) repeat protein